MNEAWKASVEGLGSPSHTYRDFSSKLRKKDISFFSG